MIPFFQSHGEKLRVIDVNKRRKKDIETQYWARNLTPGNLRDRLESNSYHHNNYITNQNKRLERFHARIYLDKRDFTSRIDDGSFVPLGFIQTNTAIYIIWTIISITLLKTWKYDKFKAILKHFYDTTRTGGGSRRWIEVAKLWNENLHHIFWS